MSLLRRWFGALSSFVKPAKNSNENGMRQIFYHDSALKAYMDAYPLDTDYPIWYARFHPLAVAANTNYTTYYSVEGAQEGKTDGLKIRLSNIQGKEGKARDWYNRTAAIYAISNPPRMKAIFNDGLKPFSGKKDKVIAALSTLSTNIGADPNLLMADIKAEIDVEYGIIKPLRDAQKASIKTTGISFKTVSDSIKAALTMQWRNQGLEINKFADDVDSENLIKGFHDLEAIQQHSQAVFNLTLNNPETLDIAQRTMVFNSHLRAKATGGDVKLFLASTAGGTDSAAVVMLDGVDTPFTAAAFGITTYGVNRHLTVVTSSGTVIKFMLQLY
jgi:hypothetical protein